MTGYILSPEFHRNLWQRFSLFRLLAVPVFIACAGYALVTYYGDDWARAILEKSFIVYYIVVVIWGNHEAANVMREEVRGNTWDSQRMSPVSPASLIFGKMFGATSYIWYAALPLLAVMLFAQFQMEGVFQAVDRQRGEIIGAFPAAPSLAQAFYFSFFMIMAGVAGHAVTFLVSFDGMVGKINADPRNRKPRTIVAFLAGWAVSHGAMFLVAEKFIREAGNTRTLFERYPSVDWYGLDVSSAVFGIAGTLFLTGWVFVGIYRLARAELLYPLTPLYWMLGVGSVSLFMAGCVFEDALFGRNNFFSGLKGHAFLFYLFITTMAATYYAMLAGAGDLRKYSRLVESVHEGRWRKVFENIPQWVASGILALASCAAFATYVLKAGYDLGALNLFIKPQMFATLAISIVLFSIRDGIVIHAISYFRGDGNQTFERTSYYVLVYFLLPALHLSLGVTGMTVTPEYLISLAQGTSVFHPLMYLGWYYPNIFSQFTYGLLPVVMQIAYAGIAVLVLHRLRQRKSAVPAQGGQA